MRHKDLAVLVAVLAEWVCGVRTQEGGPAAYAVDAVL